MSLTGMSSSNEPTSAFAYIFGAVLGGAALVATSWIAIRGRQNGGLGMPARRDPQYRPDLEAGQELVEPTEPTAPTEPTKDAE